MPSIDEIRKSAEKRANKVKSKKKSSIERDSRPWKTEKKGTEISVKKAEGHPTLKTELETPKQKKSELPLDAETTLLREKDPVSKNKNDSQSRDLLSGATTALADLKSERLAELKQDNIEPTKRLKEYIRLSQMLPAERVIHYLMLLELAEGGEIDLSQSRVAKVLGVSRDTTRRTFRALLDVGLLTLVDSYTPNKSRTYRIH